MHPRLILNGKKADRPDVRAAVAALRMAGHDLDVRVTWERGDAGRMVAEAADAGVGSHRELEGLAHRRQELQLLRDVQLQLVGAAVVDHDAVLGEGAAGLAGFQFVDRLD